MIYSLLIYCYQPYKRHDANLDLTIALDNYESENHRPRFDALNKTVTYDISLHRRRLALPTGRWHDGSLCQPVDGCDTIGSLCQPVDGCDTLEGDLSKRLITKSTSAVKVPRLD